MHTLSAPTFLKAPCKILKLLMDSCSSVDDSLTFFNDMQPYNTRSTIFVAVFHIYLNRLAS